MDIITGRALPSLSRNVLSSPSMEGFSVHQCFGWKYRLRPENREGQVASGRNAARAWLHGSSVLGAFVSAGCATECKRLAAVKASVGLLARVGPLVPRNVALVGEPP